jgi:hypothetical protein
VPRDPRTYITVPDGLPEHPKVVGLSDGAFRLLIEAWCYCSRNLTDGKIIDAAWQKMGSRKARAELEMWLDEDTPPLARRTASGVEMHDYTEHQRTALEVADLRKKRAEAGSKGGKAKANRLASANGVAKQTLYQTASKPLAESETETEVDNRG